MKRGFRTSVGCIAACALMAVSCTTQAEISQPLSPTTAAEPATAGTPDAETVAPTATAEPGEPGQETSPPGAPQWPHIRALTENERVLHVPSQAMAPTIEDGDGIILQPVSNPQVGDIVVFDPPAGTGGSNQLVKRIVAQGGDEVRFVDNQILVNGSILDEPYLLDPDSTRPRLQIPGCAQTDLARDLCVVPPNTFFMLGDNRLGSSDSRVFGPIDAAAITDVVVEIVPAQAP